MVALRVVGIVDGQHDSIAHDDPQSPVLIQMASPMRGEVDGFSDFLSEPAFHPCFRDSEPLIGSF